MGVKTWLIIKFEGFVQQTKAMKGGGGARRDVEWRGGDRIEGGLMFRSYLLL